MREKADVKGSICVIAAIPLDFNRKIRYHICVKYKMPRRVRRAQKVNMNFDNVKDIAIYGTNCDVDISLGADGVCEFLTAKEKYFNVQVDNGGQLTVTQKKNDILARIIMRKIEFKLILPADFKGRLRFRNKNGGLYIKNGAFADVELSTENGKFDIENITCDEFSLKMRNGGVTVKNVTAAREVFIKCHNGNIRAETVTAPELELSSKNAGLTAVDIKTGKFECSTHNGPIDASAVTADELRLETSNGKISAMAIGKRADYRISLETANGSITLDGTPSKNFTDAAPAKKRITARTSNSDIDLRFMG